VLQLLRKDARFFLAGSLAAWALRLVFVLHFPGIVDDSRLYADIAMNWLQYGVYGITNSGRVVPTLWQRFSPSLEGATSALSC
jgi:hypothetical protein